MSDDFENKNSEYDVYSQNASDSAKQETEGEKAAFDEPEKSDDQPAQLQGSLNDFYTKPQENRSETPYTPYGYNARQPQQNPQSQPGSNPYSAQNPQNGFGSASGAPQYTRQPQQPQYRPYGYAPGNAPAPGSPKKGGGKKVVGLVVAFVVVIAVAAIIASFIGTKGGRSQFSTTTSPAGSSSVQPSESTSSPVEYSTNASAEVKQLSAVEVAEKARKSVVGVMTYSGGKLSGEGSGVAMAHDKSKKYTYILTCAHVISDKNITYRIQTLENKTYEASLVAYDTRTDIGVLKVEATDIPLAELGDSSVLKVGETVYAIGNPGGSEYFGSMTDGIISAIDRSVSSTYTMTCIQHNAAINPGNSGGALVNSAGQVIGINSSKIAATDYEGMGFAVPIATAKSVAESLIEYGYVPNRPKLGIEYASVSSYQLYSMVVAIKGLPAGSLVIAGISTDSSLINTKAQVGDLIIGVNGKKMDDSSVLLDLINTGAVGDTITLNLCRIESRTYKTTEFDVTLTLVEDKGNTTEATTEPNTDGGYYRGGSSNFEDFFKQYFGY